MEPEWWREVGDGTRTGPGQGAQGGSEPSQGLVPPRPVQLPSLCTRQGKAMDTKIGDLNSRVMLGEWAGSREERREQDIHPTVPWEEGPSPGSSCGRGQFTEVHGPQTGFPNSTPLSQANPLIPLLLPTLTFPAALPEVPPRSTQHAARSAGAHFPSLSAATAPPSHCSSPSPATASLSLSPRPSTYTWFYLAGRFRLEWM